MEKKVVFVALADNFAAKVASLVANDLSMFFLDLDNFIEYNMFDSHAVLSRCGIEHFKKQEFRIINEAFEYENTMYYSSFELYTNNKHMFDEKSFVAVYLRLTPAQLAKVEDKNLAINKIAFEDRDAFLKQEAVVIENEFAVHKSFALAAIKILKNKNLI